MSCQDFIARHEAALKRRTEFELLFAKQVLCRVEALADSEGDPIDFSNVQTQTSIPLETSRVSGRGYIDFTIAEGDHVRLAIEVNGWDKKGIQSGETAQEFANRSRKEATINAQGWRLLSFANSHFMREPDDVARCVWLNLKRDRDLARDLRKAREESAKQEKNLATTSRDQAQLAKEKRRLDKKIARLEAALRDASKDLVHPPDGLTSREVEDLRRLNEQTAQRNSQLEDEIKVALARADEARKSAERAEEEAERAKKEAEEKERREKLIKLILGSIAVIIGGVALITWLLTREPPLPCEPPVAWTEAADCIGESTTVSGNVAGVENEDGAQSGPTFINIGQPFPDGFAVVIFDKEVVATLNRVGGFPQVGEEVCVKGEIATFEGRPQIVVETAFQVTDC